MCAGCERAPRITEAPARSKGIDMSAAIAAYHREKHTEDEKAAGVTGKIEFVDYQVDFGHIDQKTNEMMVSIRPVQKSLLDKGVASWSGEWEEKWRFDNGKMVLIEVTKGPAGILFTD